MKLIKKICLFLIGIYLVYGGNLSFNNVFQLHSLECHVRHTTFIKNTNRLFINHREARITPVIAFIQQQLMFG
jgi:hypothetical protein